MKKIIPFNKEIKFKTMLSKITSISLEHTLNVDNDNYIKGDFIVSGTYKLTQASQIDEDFSYKIPIEIQIDEKYNVDNVILDIDDFTYEIIDEDTLNVNICLCIDNLEEKNIYLESIEEDEIESVRFDEEPNDLFLDTTEEQDLSIPINDSKIDGNINDQEIVTNNYNNIDINFKNEKNNINEESNNDSEMVSSLFASFKDNTETFKTYSVYVVKEEDTIDSILNKYGIDKEMLEEYNDISSMNIGSKLIIPCGKNE